MTRKPESHPCECGLTEWARATRYAIAIVDARDAWLLRSFGWHMLFPGRLTPYAASNTAKKRVGQRLLHRAVLGTEAGPVTDHINGNGFDCRRENLRACTQRQNTYNRRKHRGATSKYRGVSWSAKKNRWVAQVQADGKLTHLGYFEGECEAALAFDAAARRLHGDFAKTNFQAAR